MKTVVIVAHPDDEIIWCGGFIMQNPNWDWTILSLTRSEDTDRCPKFHRVCDILGAKAHLSNLDDSNPLKPINRRREIGGRIVEHLGMTSWDLCITHGVNGEYGHQRHKEIHKEVLELICDGILQCGELWTLAYDCNAQTRICMVASQADVMVDLSENHLREKQRIIRDVYGYGEESFEFSACITPEGFCKWELPKQE